MVILLVAVAGSGGLSWLWFKHEKLTLLWVGQWHPSSPVSENLAGWLHLDWGGQFSITETPGSDRPDFVALTYRQWRVGPFLVRRVIYRNPKSQLTVL
jgi:hypothetical protein